MDHQEGNPQGQQPEQPNINQPRQQESSIFDRMPTLRSEDYRKMQATGEIDKASVRPVMSEAEIQAIKENGHVPLEVVNRMFKEAEDAGNRGYNSVIKQYRDEISFQTYKVNSEGYRATQPVTSGATLDRAIGDLARQNVMEKSSGLADKLTTSNTEPNSNQNSYPSSTS